MKMITAKSPDSNVAIVEKLKDKAEEIAQKYPGVTAILGDALDNDLLQEISADVNTAIVSTDNDEVNVLAALMLKQFQTERVLTLVKSRNFNSLLPIGSGCSIINPSAIAIETILQKSRDGHIISAIQLKNQDAYVIEAEAAESCVGLGETMEFLEDKGQIVPVFIVRNGEVARIHRDTVIQLGDRMIILATRERLNSVEKIFSSYVFSKK
jgi:trk system potassium uptake protein TrkA